MNNVTTLGKPSAAYPNASDAWLASCHDAYDQDDFRFCYAGTTGTITPLHRDGTFLLLMQFVCTATLMQIPPTRGQPTLQAARDGDFSRPKMLHFCDAFPISVRQNLRRRMTTWSGVTQTKSLVLTRMGLAAGLAGQRCVLVSMRCTKNQGRRYLCRLIGITKSKTSQTA